MCLALLPCVAGFFVCAFVHALALAIVCCQGSLELPCSMAKAQTRTPTSTSTSTRRTRASTSTSREEHLPVFFSSFDVFCTVCLPLCLLLLLLTQVRSSMRRSTLSSRVTTSRWCFAMCSSCVEERRTVCRSAEAGLDSKRLGPTRIRLKP